MIKMKVESNSRKLDLQTSRKHEVKTLGAASRWCCWIVSWVFASAKRSRKTGKLAPDPLLQSDPIWPSADPRIAYLDHGDLAFQLDLG